MKVNGSTLGPLFAYGNWDSLGIRDILWLMNRHICMNEDCARYLDTQVTRWQVGDRVKVPCPSTREMKPGTVSEIPCGSCERCMELER